MKIAQPLKWWGGKSYLAKKIIDLMPRHLHYVEPYGGGLAVLLNKDPFDPRHQWGEKRHESGVSEVVNDLLSALQNFWQVLQDERAFMRFRRTVDATPFSERQFEAARKHAPQAKLDVAAAVKLFIRCRQSRCGAFNDFATLSRNRTRRMMNEQVSAWQRTVDGLPEVHSRLKRVVILCRDALDVIRQQDGEKTLFYLDPPYLHRTRATTGEYAHELTEYDHRSLLEAITDCKGAVMLSGYTNNLYEIALKDWNRHDFEIDNKAAGGKTKRIMTESVWCNF
ncbi:DNA adenine methylase [Novipirellula artificiosorum]|uniref:D12 class N6 adenine-specific DNA methyltransferase n=1 Tax=Novipirellula artificiosorum TaxID=2528016 RepID=A0A5C6CE68_9BACT|nr:DNA adenine methylase [Novipirellula artificiosorum]TWU22558.1 D12 class N6 adenine-specific DNA methyltransferase [Novipirellula artificiosorum]